MGRTIVTSTDVKRATAAITEHREFGVETGRAAGGGVAVQAAPKADTYADKLLKYIPADVIAIYLTLQGIVTAGAASINVNLISWIVFIVMVGLTPFWLSRVGGVKKGLQIFLSTFAFAVWVFSLGGPFAGLSWYNPVYGALILPIVTFALPIVNPDGHHGNSAATS